MCFMCLFVNATCFMCLFVNATCFLCLFVNATCFMCLFVNVTCFMCLFVNVMCFLDYPELRPHLQSTTPALLITLFVSLISFHPACSACPLPHTTMRCTLSKATLVQLKGNWTPPHGWGNPDPTILVGESSPSSPMNHSEKGEGLHLFTPR